eukprot:CAMPEP_0115697126 /NCGR_PEP_ID=MMETSP0272-20121206/65635_1 /TAXON_ID=71861 /ORGANISM="Scrippsiella trochoidea, Strain CCMP3099" /LENGTH=127 /DNA_ID=CAMNT_0003137375 /DNA_START=1 /DNA_END=381 /DNA_ORIENTATION=+
MRHLGSSPTPSYSSMSAAFMARRLAAPGTSSRLMPVAGVAASGPMRHLGSSPTSIRPSRRTGCAGSVVVSAAARMQMRTYSAGGDPAFNDVRKLLNDAFDSNAAVFADYAKTKEMDMATFQKLIDIV